MKSIVLAALAALALAACGDQTPPPAAKKAEPVPVVPVPTPQAKAPEAPKPEAKAEEPKPDPNKELAQKVKKALEGEAKIQAAGIDVTANNGTVTLWGTAATAGERNRAAAAASKVEGVKTVENKIAVVKGS
ncbi:MAG: BON domain-containing protein [Burkholderiales bacterium]